MQNFDLPTEIISALNAMNIKSATEIQAKTIPIAIQGRDILASSQTGSGKTLAFLLPIINSFIKTQSHALVLVPTRELATQVRDAFIKVTAQFKMPSALLIGGEPMPKQFSQLKNNPKIIIGTPGRVIDHLTRGTLKLNKVGTLVLDEMDRMLNMGMKEQIEEINKHLPNEKQVLMFSATMPAYIMELSRKYMINPERISVGSTTKPAAQIVQENINIDENDKFSELLKQLAKRQGSIIIFVKTKRGADKLAKMLTAQDHRSESLHGDLTQSRRDRVILSFRRSNYRILVATDVAARGLDIPHTEHVINFDLPMCAEDYLHRIGRTGRAGASGNALSFVSRDDASKWRAIDRLINKGEGSTGDAVFDRKGSAGGNNRRKPFGSRSDRPAFGDRKRTAGFAPRPERKDFDNTQVVYRKKKTA